jgi:hypothetical protein
MTIASATTKTRRVSTTLFPLAISSDGSVAVLRTSLDHGFSLYRAGHLTRVTSKGQVLAMTQSGRFVLFSQDSQDCSTGYCKFASVPMLLDTQTGARSRSPVDFGVSRIREYLLSNDTRELVTVTETSTVENPCPEACARITALDTATGQPAFTQEQKPGSYLPSLSDDGKTLFYTAVMHNSGLLSVVTPR